ncbi:MAG: DUF4215 domain-containing protein [Polyangiaceae bacterium]|nr:DUF4215 domain-containing protein [Polyangiaceae bacterium]
MSLRIALASALLLGCAFGEPIDRDAFGGSSNDAGGGGSTNDTSSSAGGDTADGAAGGGAGGTEVDGGSGSGGAPPACGDGTVDPTEACDDGNALAGDGCADCAIECEAAALQDPLTGHCYRLFAIATNQTLAEAGCEAWGGTPGIGHLASMGDQLENDFVAPLVGGDTWIGADDLGGAWAWIDGTPYAFENWQDGEPNHPGTEHCMFMDLEARWHDHDCADTRSAYLCERVGAGTL